MIKHYKNININNGDSCIKINRNYISVEKYFTKKKLIEKICVGMSCQLISEFKCQEKGKFLNCFKSNFFN